MDEQQQVAAEIAAAQGTIDAEALDAKIEATEQIKEAKTESKKESKSEKQATKEVTPSSVVMVDPILLQQTIKETVEKTAKETARTVFQELTVKSEEKPKEQPKETKVEPKAESLSPETKNKDSKTEEFHTLSTPAFKALKIKAEEKGRKTAMEDLNKTVQEAGYNSLKDALAELKQLKQALQSNAQPATQKAEVASASVAQVLPQSTPANPESKPQSGFIEAELRKERKEKERLVAALEAEKQRAQQAERSAKSSQKKIEAMEIDQELREAAIKSNIKDVDYAMTLLQRDLANKSEEELRNFNETEYFSNLRNTHGHLFGERVELATTSKATDLHPSVTQAQKQTANQIGKKNGMQVPDQDYRARLKELGLSMPNS